MDTYSCERFIIHLYKFDLLPKNGSKKNPYRPTSLQQVIKTASIEWCTAKWCCILVAQKRKRER